MLTGITREDDVARCAEKVAPLFVTESVADVRDILVFGEDMTNEDEEKQAIAELFAVSRTLGTVANNVNQLARYANTEGHFPAEAEAVVAEYRQLSARIDETIRRLAGA